MLDSDRKYKGEAHMETYKYEKIRNVAVLGQERQLLSRRWHIRRAL